MPYFPSFSKTTYDYQREKLKQDLRMAFGHINDSKIYLGATEKNLSISLA